MSTCFGCEIQTVYSCLNRTEITENRHQKLKPNRIEKNLNRGSPNKQGIDGQWLPMPPLNSSTVHVVLYIPVHCTVEKNID